MQSDIRQYEGMSRELKEHRIEKGEETYWVNNAFGGMPTPWHPILLKERKSC